MSRGRKSVKFKGTDWESVAKDSLGFYFEFILSQLASKTDLPLTNKNATELAKAIEKEKNVLLEKRKLRLNNSKPKNEIIELRFEIPSNWEWHLLSDFVFYQEGPGIRTHQYRTSGIKLLNVQNITQDKLMLDLTERFISIEEYESKYKHFTIEKEDILFASSGGSWGKTCWFENPNYNVILNTSTMRLRSFSEKGLLNNFLYIFLKTPFFRNQLIPQLMGMQPNFGSTHLNSVSIPIPPVEEQELILNYLYAFCDNKLRAKIYFNEEVENGIKQLQQTQLNANKLSIEFSHQLEFIKQLSQSLLKEAMQGKLATQNSKDGNASELLKKIKTEKEKLIAEKKIKRGKPFPVIQEEEIPFTIPENWVWCRLGELCIKIGSGSTPKGSNYSKKGKPFFRSQNIYNYRLVYNDINFISDNVHEQMNGTVVYANDILLNITGGSMGRCALVPNDFEEGNVSQHVCIIRPICINNKFLHYIVLSPFFQKFIFSSTTGDGREGLPKYNLEQFLIPLPPIKEQERIVHKIEKLLNLCEDLTTSVTHNQKYTDLLLQVALKEALQMKEVKVGN